MKAVTEDLTNAEHDTRRRRRRRRKGFLTNVNFKGFTSVYAYVRQSTTGKCRSRFDPSYGEPLSLGGWLTRQQQQAEEKSKYMKQQSREEDEESIR